MDGIDHHPSAQSHEGNSKIRVAPLQSGRLYPTQYFVKIELQKWLDSPFIEPDKPPQNVVQGDLFS